MPAYSSVNIRIFMNFACNEDTAGQALRYLLSEKYGFYAGIHTNKQGRCYRIETGASSGV
jgi:hypothetical protein